ncbi:hypothetical protein ACWDR0_01175 [Streptomyces sp. NPDC003691]
MRALTRRGRAAGVPAALALALALALTGCGSGGGGDPKVASAPSAKETGGPARDGAPGDTAVPDDDRAKARKFADCLRKHGLDVGDPEEGRFTMDGNGLSEEKAKKATEACRAFQPQGKGKGKGKPDAKMVEAMRTFAECMRTNGVEKFPDPASGGGIQIDGSITEDPDFKAAEKKCQADMPKGPGKKDLDG